MRKRLGIWLIGAKGGVATTTIVGLVALQRGAIATTGLASNVSPLNRLDLPDWDQFVVGGHEIRSASLVEESRRLVDESRTVSPELFERVAGELAVIDARIRPGTLFNCGERIAALAAGETGADPRSRVFRVPAEESPRQAVERLRNDLEQFAAAEKLAHTVVVNVASTEPAAVEAALLPRAWAEFAGLLERRDCPLPASTLYSIAALEAGCSVINFTPSLGVAPPALDELACLRSTRYMGCDGKTGETLLKSALAPMFAHRNLRVMSWVGHNIFGNMDGQVLSDPANKQTKVASKDRLIGEILGYRPQTHVSIEYIESLGDWKTAWDHVHFQGFLGVPMTLQLTWQGCDSALAAPLVLDLVRLTEVARQRGQVGRMPFLACFFKSPQGVAEHGFERQWQMLERWAAEGAA